MQIKTKENFVFFHALTDNTYMTFLPEAYQQEMKSLLGEEYDAYLHSFERPVYHGLRVNTLKISVKDFLDQFPYHLEHVPWCDNGFYYDPADPVTKHPYYYAGLYYIQEPSAMLPACIIPIERDDRVLDVCAAPGGKSTELGAKLNGTGILVSNDISVSRCQALVKNIERAGIRNAFVMAENTNHLKEYFKGYFDKILIDAPCSGEGMFHKEPSLMTSWMEHGPSWYAEKQKEIISDCLSMLKDGGMLVYSTCTFSTCEDEEMIQYALSLDNSLHVIPIPCQEGFVQNTYGTKLFPHRVKGEGHFVALLQKGSQKEKISVKTKEIRWNQDSIHIDFHNTDMQSIRNHVYAVPETDVNMQGLRILRSGLLLGEEKKNRFELEPVLGCALKEDECDQVLNLSGDDERVIRYLKGETLMIDDFSLKDGIVLVCVDHHALGFGKVTHGQFRNKYPKGWIYH